MAGPGDKQLVAAGPILLKHLSNPCKTFHIETFKHMKLNKSNKSYVNVLGFECPAPHPEEGTAAGYLLKSQTAKKLIVLR